MDSDKHGDRARNRVNCGPHSFILAISIAPLRVHYYSEALPTTAGILLCIGVSRRSAQATVSKGLAQGPYEAARAEVKPTTLRLRVIDLTNALPRPAQWSNEAGIIKECVRHGNQRLIISPTFPVITILHIKEMHELIFSQISCHCNAKRLLVNIPRIIQLQFTK